MTTNVELVLQTVGTLSVLYLILQWAIPKIKKAYAEHGAIVLIGLYFLVKWLLQTAG